MTRALGNSSTIVTYDAAVCNEFGGGVSDPILRIQSYCCQGHQTPPPNGTKKHPGGGRKTHVRNLGGAWGRCWAQLWFEGSFRVLPDYQLLFPGVPNYSLQWENAWPGVFPL